MNPSQNIIDKLRNAGWVVYYLWTEGEEEEAKEVLRGVVFGGNYFGKIGGGE